MILSNTYKLSNKLFSNKKSIILLFLLFILSCDETPPYVHIISPIENTVMPGEISTIIAEAYDNDGDGKVVSVDFYVDGIFIGTDNHASSNNLWEYPWNVSYWADSSDHSITAKALDYSNNIGQSNIVTVMVPSGIEILPALYQPQQTEEIDYTNKPTFTWFGLNSTIKYDIEISEFNDIHDYESCETCIEEHVEFENNVRLDTTVTDTSFTIHFALTNETKGFYWHIRGENESGALSDWSDTWVFKIAGPEPPLLDAPTNNDGPQASLPTFTWLNLGSSATEYNIEISTVNDECVITGDLENCFNNIAFSDNVDRTPGSAQSYIPSQNVSLLSGLHWWRVRCKNQYDIWGDWSEAKSFTISEPNAPEIISPINGEIITNTVQPEFNWGFNESSTQHHIQISTNQGMNFEDSIYIDRNSNTNSFNIENLEDSLNVREGINYWRVKSSNNTNAWSDWSNIYQFRISGTPPPNVIVPHSNSIYTQYTPLSFEWEASIDDDGNPAIMYQIQINYNESENSQRDVIVEIENNEDLEYVFEEELTFLTDESYYRIRSKNQLGFWGDWSSCDLNELNEPMNCNSVKDYVRFFYEPDPPILQFPIDIEILTRPTFTWQEEAGADQYGIQLSSVSGNNFEDGIIIDDVVSNNEYSINSYSFESAGDATLYWRVKSIANANGDDLSSDWSEQGEFEAIKPLSPILEYPLNGILINENLQFDWSDSEGAQNYQIKVSDNYSFNSNGTIIDATPDGSYLNSFEFINDVLAGNYYWKVRTKSELGIWSEYSDVGFFEIDNPPTPQLNFPLDLSSLAEIDTLEWTSLIDLSQYEIEITNQHSEEIFIYYSETTDFLISSDIINNGTHFWKVRSKNNMEMWSQWSDIWSFWVPYNFYDEGEDFIQLQNMSVSKYLISIEQYIDFLNEAYHDPLEYIVIRGQYIKGYCDEMPEEEEQIYFKTATASDIYPYNLANVRWDDNEEIFYFEGINDLIYDNHPMVFVTWCGAKAFTKHYDLDLPTSVEWHNAIYESGWSDDSLYIDENFNGEWDEQEERASYLNFYESSDPWDLPGGTTPINFYQHPSSDLKDGLGNVWEWTNDIDGSYRHCMGGSYINTIEEISIDTIRTVNNGSNSVNKDIGFRVIKRND